ncbi:hypothetical protein AB0L00_05990 [Actinoallomurus sp. NPDC052308]|uniref:hypothetical protein n=1 Tax=Actinoallomurus sp. NPDC052308 TaxID=3155530 RepID=UPI003432F147
MVSRPRPLTDVAPAAWIEAGVGDFDSGVHALLPAGFAAYARLPHPVEAADGRPLRWREIAERSGRALDSRTRFKDIAGPADEEPWAGSFPAGLLPVLCEILAAHTATPGHCYFGLWDGWGWLDADGPRFHLPGRDHLLYEGPLDAATEFGDRGPGYFFQQSPNVVWPQDRSWCVATDVDLDSTYVGGSARLVEDLTGGTRIEALPAELSDPLG